MIVSFILTMPSFNTWNNHWSGENTLFARVKSFRQTTKLKEKLDRILAIKRFYYDFGDGWTACIEVKQVSRSEAQKLRRKSNGFMSYDWMIKSILENEVIRVPSRTTSS